MFGPVLIYLIMKDGEFFVPDVFPKLQRLSLHVVPIKHTLAFSSQRAQVEVLLEDFGPLTTEDILPPRWPESLRNMCSPHFATRACGFATRNQLVLVDILFELIIFRSVLLAMKLPLDEKIFSRSPNFFFDDRNFHRPIEGKRFVLFWFALLMQRHRKFDRLVLKTWPWW